MIDTHTHLYDEAFKDDFEETLERAAGAGVEHMVFPGIDSSVHGRMMECAARAPEMISTAAGLHPTSVDGNWKHELDFVEKRLADGGWAAVGEIGLDRHWSDTYIREQVEVFRRQMIWASELHLPVIIHVRDAHDTVFEVLDSLAEEGVRMKGVFHAFSGSIETFRRIKTYGDFKTGHTPGDGFPLADPSPVPRPQKRVRLHRPGGRAHSRPQEREYRRSGPYYYGQRKRTV